MDVKHGQILGNFLSGFQPTRTSPTHVRQQNICAQGHHL